MKRLLRNKTRRKISTINFYMCKHTCHTLFINVLKIKPNKEPLKHASHGSTVIESYIKFKLKNK